MDSVIEAEISKDRPGAERDPTPSLGGRSRVDPPACRPTLRLHLIGQMRACVDGTQVVLPRTRKTRAALAVLALAAPQPVLRTHLTSLLWSRREPEQARASLRQSLHELQIMLAATGAGRVVAERHHLSLESTGLWVDCHAVARATATRPEALDLFDHALLSDLVGLDPAFDSWIVGETTRLRAGASHVAAALLEARREPGEVMEAAKRLLLLAPTHEGAWRALMRTLAEAGDRAAAVQAYESCASALAEQVGTEPDTETRLLLAQLQESAWHGWTAPSEPQRPAIRPEASGRLWLCVAAFRALDPADTMLCEGLAEEITAAFSRFRWISLAAPGSIVSQTHDHYDERRHAPRIDVDFMLDGSVQRFDQRIRVNVRLLDMRAGREVVWSSRFDRAADDLLALQDEIAAAIAAQVDPQLLLRESRRVKLRSGIQNVAYDLMVCAIPSLYRLEKASFREAGQLLARAAALAPDSGEIRGWWAFWHFFLVGQGWARDDAGAFRRAGELAEQAVALDPSCARAIAVAGHVRSFVQHHSIEETIGTHERALALNPNLPLAWVTSGLAHSYAGQHHEAIKRISRARALSPFDPHEFFFESALALPHLLTHDFESAAALGRDALSLNPSMSSTHKGLLAALGHLGRSEEAHAVRVRLEVLEPGFTIASATARSALRRPEDLQVYLEGLRRAGLPQE